MQTPYINGQLVDFQGDTMVVQFTSKTRRLNAEPLRNVPGKFGYFVYTFTYSPAEKSKLNGVPANEIAKEDLPFITELLGGVKLASVYTEMKAKHAAMLARRPRRAGRGECTCGRCFDCVAQ